MNAATDNSWDDEEEYEHGDDAVQNLVRGLVREKKQILARAEAAESDAKHVRAINATLLETMAAETKRADEAERALAEAREKVKHMERFGLSSAIPEIVVQPNGWFVHRSEVLAALGVES